MNNHRNPLRNGKIQHTFSYILISVLTLGGCATTKVADQEGKAQPIVASKVDPYESVNRKIYGFNDSVDNYVAEPISNVYKKITPQFMQTGIFNFFNNLKNVNVVLNDVLQAKFEQSAKDTGRFAINSTVGLVGLFDVAKKVGLEQNDEDFDQTLAVWGVPRGPYLVIPFLGPVTARGIPGVVVDTAANPSSYVGAPVQLVSLLNTRASAEGALKFIDEAALDPYVFTRESFLQWRQSLATDGKGQATSEFDDELIEDEAASNDQGSSTASTSAGKTLQVSSSSSDTKNFKDVSRLFDGVTQSFGQTAKSFEEAGNKLEGLKAK